MAQNTRTSPIDSDAQMRERIAAILAAVEAQDAHQVNTLLEPVHPADIADLLEQISDTERAALMALWQGSIDGDILAELDENIREDIIESLNPAQLAVAVRDMDSDDVVDLVEDLDEPQQEAVLEALEDAERAVVQHSLSYPENSAGRLMQREVVMTPNHWSVGEAIDFMRKAKDLPEQFYHLIMVDARIRPVGYVTLGRLLSAPRKMPLSEITEESFQSIRADTPEAEVAYKFNQYHLISAPVVDADDRLVGVITIDDAMGVLDAEHEEDILRLAGVGESSLSDGAIETTKRRLPWLAVNLGTAILASIVIAQFEAVLAQVVALAVLMPIVASMGGNAGTQSLTVAVRALATKDLTPSNVWRVIRREVLVSLFNGLIFAAAMGLICYIWFGSAVLAMVLGVAMIINLAVAGLAGVMIPLALTRYKIDPALASGAFVTTVTDVVGFWAFLGLAAWILL